MFFGRPVYKELLYSFIWVKRERKTTSSTNYLCQSLIGPAYCVAIKSLWEFVFNVRWKASKIAYKLVLHSKINYHWLQMPQNKPIHITKYEITLTYHQIECDIQYVSVSKVSDNFSRHRFQFPLPKLLKDSILPYISPTLYHSHTPSCLQIGSRVGAAAC